MILIYVSCWFRGPLDYIRIQIQASSSLFGLRLPLHWCCFSPHHILLNESWPQLKYLKTFGFCPFSVSCTFRITRLSCMHGRTYLRTSRESLTVFLKKQQDIDRLDFFNGSQLSIFEESRTNHPFGDICLSRKKTSKDTEEKVVTRNYWNLARYLSTIQLISILIKLCDNMQHSPNKKLISCQFFLPPQFSAICKIEVLWHLHKIFFWRFCTGLMRNLFS